MNCNDSMINNSILKKRNDPAEISKSLPFQTDISAINLLKTRLNGSANGTRTLSFLEEKDLPEDEYKALAKKYSGYL